MGSSRPRSSASAWRPRWRARARSTSGRRPAASRRRLLAHGAHSVLAADVGHGQLHASLRADPRVTSLEGVDWKRLSLAVAEGPFDFFTVDVSFVAARNMLRGLAFRLRAGAEGVVLVKPQFELPDKRVKAAGADDRAPARGSAGQGARARARARLRGRRSLRFAGGGRQRHRRGAGPPALRWPPRHDAPAGRAKTRRRAARRRARRARPRRCAGSPSSRPASRTSRATSWRRCPTWRRSRPKPAASPGRVRRRAACARIFCRAWRRACWPASARWTPASSASCATAPRACPGGSSSRPGRRWPRARARATAACITPARSRRRPCWPSRMRSRARAPPGATRTPT